jgi:peptidoglycan/xylan/chitin deacetylase (PgdA/CDA1 family)
VSEASFEAQMRYLKQNGYRVISLAELLQFMEFKQDIPPKAVVITIDDGWHSTLDIALPILKRYRFPATLFVRTQFIGRRQALSWQELQSMFASDIDIQCSAPAVSKPADLRDKDVFVSYVKNQDRQLSAVQKAFRKYLQRECACVAYPGGETNNLTVALVRKQGFRAGFLLNDEPNPFFVDPYFIGRTRVSGDEDLDRFEQKLTVFSKWPLD